MLLVALPQGPLPLRQLKGLPGRPCPGPGRASTRVSGPSVQGRGRRAIRSVGAPPPCLSWSWPPRVCPRHCRPALPCPPPSTRGLGPSATLPGQSPHLLYWSRVEVTTGRLESSPSDHVRVPSHAWSPDQGPSVLGRHGTGSLWLGSSSLVGWDPAVCPPASGGRGTLSGQCPGSRRACQGCPAQPPRPQVLPL